MSTSLEYNPWGLHGHRTQAPYTDRIRTHEGEVSTSFEYNPWGVCGHRTQARYTHRGTRPSDTGPIYTSKSPSKPTLDVYIGHECDGWTRVQWLCTPSLRLAPASTLLPGCCPNGHLGLDSSFLLQTASWDAPRHGCVRPRSMLAHTSTLLPGCCRSGLLGLDSGFVLQTASWDAPQQTRAPAPLCLFLHTSEQMLCTRTDLLVTQPH